MTTNDQLDNIAQGALEMIIEDEAFEELNAHERTLLCAKIAAKFAQYAADEVNF